MSEPKDFNARVPAFVKRYERKCFEASTTLAGSRGVSGKGETEAAARADLERNLAWVSHYVGAFVAHDGEGNPWLCTVGYHHGTWIVVRITGDKQGLSSGSSIIQAPSYSRLRETILEWNKPEARRFG
jgi:hypothetical protein